MRQYGELEQEKKNILKAIRSAIRLKHSIEADIELNDRLPLIELEIDAAMNDGREYTVDIDDYLQG
jgi:hypothetical protein